MCKKKKEMCLSKKGSSEWTSETLVEENIYVSRFRDSFNFNFTRCHSCLLLSRCWLGQADVKTAWCTSGEDFDHNKGEHGCFHCTDRITNRLL
jgi:hypothetical protein